MELCLTAHINSPAAEPPKIVQLPQTQKNAVPRTNVVFTVEAIGTTPLRFQWEWNCISEEEMGGDGWQSIPLDVERFQGADTATLTITSVQKSDEGEYRCTVRNYAGSETSEAAVLTVGKTHKCYITIDILFHIK